MHTRLHINQVTFDRECKKGAVLTKIELFPRHQMLLPDVERKDRDSNMTTHDHRSRVALREMTNYL
jgi:hypothetical protein